MEHTIVTYIQRLRQSFAESSKTGSEEFVRGGRLALELAEQELAETSLFNVKQQLDTVQEELEDVSDQLVRAKEQNRLQQQEIDRLKKGVKHDRKSSKQQTSINKLQNHWALRLQSIVAGLTIGKQRFGAEPPSEAERIDSVVRQIGRWLQDFPNDTITNEDRIAAGLFARLPELHIKARGAAVTSTLDALPLNENQLVQLRIYAQKVATLTKFEKTGIKLIDRLYELMKQGKEERIALANATEGQPILVSFLKQWELVADTLEDLQQQPEAFK